MIRRLHVSRFTISSATISPNGNAHVNAGDTAFGRRPERTASRTSRETGNVRADVAVHRLDRIQRSPRIPVGHLHQQVNRLIRQPDGLARFPFPVSRFTNSAASGRIHVPDPSPERAGMLVVEQRHFPPRSLVVLIVGVHRRLQRAHVRQYDARRHRRLSRPGPRRDPRWLSACRCPDGRA